MLYDYILSTGDATISGCNSVGLGTNKLNHADRELANSAGNFYFKSSLAKESVFMKLALGGQTLFQEHPTITVATNENVYSIRSGDFFTKESGANIIEKSQLFFDGTPVNAESSLSFNVFLSGLSGSFVGTGKLDGSGIGNNLGSGISGVFPNAAMNDFDFFLNGQKVYSGLGVSGYMEGAMTTFVPNFSTGAGGIVYSADEDSFKATAYPKKPRINEITGAAADIYGSSFIEEQTELYLNGIKEHPSCYLELYTGVTSIVTGVGAAIYYLRRDAITAYLSL